MYFSEKILVNTKKELLEEDAWLHLPITLKSPFPNSRTSLLDYAARFVSLVWHDCLDNEIQKSNLRINTIKEMIANRSFSYLVLRWVIGKINTKRINILNFSFPNEFLGSSWNEILVHRFQKQLLKRQLSALIIFLSVGHYSKKSGNSIMRYMTYVGEYYNREKKLYTACYYSFLVYNFKHSKQVLL